MSHSNKFSLWQKIKQLLTASAALSVAESRDRYQHASTTEVNDDSLPAETHGVEKKSTNEKAVDKRTTAENKERPQAHTLARNTEPKNNNDTPIVDRLKEFLSHKQWHYTYYPPRKNDNQQSHHLSLRMRNKQIDCGYLFRVQESNNLLAVYGILPFLIPESHQSSAMLLITQINYDMLIGNLEMDINDGEIRYKNAIDVDAIGLDDPIIEHLLQTVIAMTTVSHELFSDLMNTQEPSEDMATLLSELRQQEDDRTFFLPTQYVQ